MKYLLLFSLMFGSRAYGQVNDSIAIARLIINDYKTFNTWDYVQHKLNCLPNYYLIENGVIMTLQDEVNYFKKNAHRRIRRKDRFYFTSISVKGDFGYAIYKLESIIEEKGKSKYYNWTESAVCEKTTSGWRLGLIHSTPIK